MVTCECCWCETGTMTTRESDIGEEGLVRLFESVRDAAYCIINKKGATFYGIAVALARITKAILNDENTVLPLSVYQYEQYQGIKDVFIGQPAIIGAHGIVRQSAIERC